MAETELTKEIKRELFKYTEANGLGIYGCFEVSVGEGYGSEYCDFMTMSSKNVFRAYEIKISLSDLKSKSALTFVGDFNYFVLSEKLYNNPATDEILRPYKIHGIGILVYKGRYFHQEAKAKNKNLTVGAKVSLMHCMIRSLSRYPVKMLNSEGAGK